MNLRLIVLLVSVTLVAGCEVDKSNPNDGVVGESLPVTLQGSSSRYLAWPAIAAVGDSVIVSLYTDTDEHMGPNGQIVAVRSTDDGLTWSKPYVVYDTPLDERESGVTALSDGSLLAHVWSTRHTRESYAAMGSGSYYDDVIEAWVEQVGSDNYQEAAHLAGAWVLRSVDSGLTWSAPERGPDTIHGGIELLDGRIMVASYRVSRDYVTISAAEDWKGPWMDVGQIVSPEPDSLRFGEPSIAQLPSGRIVVMMRTTTKPYNDADDRCFLWLVYSDDAGTTWSAPIRTPLWGFPPHLLVLSDGRLLVTYGHRRPPYGQRAAISEDGITWRIEDEVVLRDDGPNKDLGYPASVQLANDQILTVYYQSHPSDTLRPPAGPPPGRHKPDILGTIWSVDSNY